MLDGMTETPEKSPSEPPERPDRHERDDSADTERDTIALPSHVAGSGTLDRLVETARDYARQAASENTLKAYTKDWAHFARWCRMRGADPLPSSSQLIGLYIADLAAPSGKAPALSASSIERRLSGLTWGYAQRGERLDRKDRHIASVLAGIRRKHARPPAQKEAILPEDLRDMLATLPHDLRGLRDRAILLIGFAGGLRRSEIVSLDHGKDDTPELRRLGRDLGGRRAPHPARQDRLARGRNRPRLIRSDLPGPCPDAVAALRKDRLRPDLRRHVTQRPESYERAVVGQARRPADQVLRPRGRATP